ncbi:hypothetical protein [Amycolatopsis sp.]|uniref:hypothetical protein n=1 Tax=Amycolatopsis sp. TaxID=37632 RepID=UPI0026061EAC|nr:hypothetical protein [Amycolatopsis sp.]
MDLTVGHVGRVLVLWLLRFLRWVRRVGDVVKATFTASCADAWNLRVSGGWSVEVGGFGSTAARTGASWCLRKGSESLSRRVG